MCEINRTMIGHVHIITRDGFICLFKRCMRDSGYISPISFTVEKGETLKDGASREVFEEAGISIQPQHILLTGHSFECSTPNKNLPIKGLSLLSIVQDLTLFRSKLKLNEELVDFMPCNFSNALNKIEMQEARSGLIYIASYLYSIS